MFLQRMYKFSSPLTKSGAPSYLTIWMDMTSLPNSLHEIWLVFTEKQLCEEKNNIGHATTRSTVFVVIFFCFQLCQYRHEPHSNCGKKCLHWFAYNSRIMIEKFAWQFESKHKSDEGLNTSILH